VTNQPAAFIFLKAFGNESFSLLDKRCDDGLTVDDSIPIARRGVRALIAGIILAAKV
jgi:hypothetical protein